MLLMFMFDRFIFISSGVLVMLLMCSVVFR